MSSRGKITSSKWAEIRKMGRKQYVLRHGVIGWGIPVAILFPLIGVVTDGWGEFLPRLVASVIIFPLGGILFGRFMWWFFERMYGKESC